MLCVLPDRGDLRPKLPTVVGAGVSKHGDFKLQLFEGPRHGNVCWITQTQGGDEQRFRCDPEQLRDLRYVVEKALRALEKHE